MTSSTAGGPQAPAGIVTSALEARLIARLGQAKVDRLRALLEELDRAVRTRER